MDAAGQYSAQAQAAYQAPAASASTSYQQPYGYDWSAYHQHYAGWPGYANPVAAPQQPAGDQAPPPPPPDDAPPGVDAPLQEADQQQRAEASQAAAQQQYAQGTPSAYYGAYSHWPNYAPAAGAYAQAWQYPGAYGMQNSGQHGAAQTYSAGATTQQAGQASSSTPATTGHTAPGQVQHPWQQSRQPPPLQQQHQQQAAAASSANNGFKIRPQGVGAYAPKFVSAKQRLAAAALSKPAYISISLAKQAVQQAAKPAQDEAKGAAAWPESLRSFVARMFAACKTEDDRTKTQEVLKKMIKDAQDAGEMWTRDWDALSNGEPATASALAPQPTYRSVSTAYSQVANHRPYSRQMPTPGRGRKAKRARSPSPSTSRSSDSTYSSSPPRRSASEERRLARRANRFGNGAAMGSTQLHYGRTPMVGKKKQRAHWASAEPGPPEEDVDLSKLPVVRGTCMQLEKSYFRLTSDLNPATIRPEPVLLQALQRLLDIVRAKQEGYIYVSDQFKAMRQDCIVQHLKSPVVIAIFEAHARAALEYGDMGEFNQCQTQLLSLYKEGLPGCKAEFYAYHILYHTVHARTGGSSALLTAMRSVAEVADEPAVAHALRVREAMGAGNKPQFCTLYASAPNMGRALMDSLLPQVRFSALNMLVKAFAPTLPLPFVASVLGFMQSEQGRDGALASEANGNDALPGASLPVFPGRFAVQVEERGAEECLEWLHAHGVVFAPNTGTAAAEAVLDCKASSGLLTIPQDADAVAHGDVKLAIDDFLSRAVRG